MIGCLSLVHASHLLVARDGARAVTACGLAIDEPEAHGVHFVEDTASATCPGCRDRPPRPEVGA